MWLEWRTMERRSSSDATRQRGGGEAERRQRGKAGAPALIGGTKTPEGTKGKLILGKEGLFSGRGGWVWQGGGGSFPHRGRLAYFITAGPQ